MSDDWTAEYKAKVRDFMERKGRPVEFIPARFGDADGLDVSPYGWVDFDADSHCHPEPRGEGCSWVVPVGSVLTEETYSQFTDTVSPNNDEVGSNASGCHCACGKYTDVTLRWTGSVSEMLHDILGINRKLSVTL